MTHARMHRSDLRARRARARDAWQAFVGSGGEAGPRPRPEILQSWRLSRPWVEPEVAAAPLADEEETRAYWQESPLQVAVARVEEELRLTADDGDLVVAVTDPDTRILWTYGGRVMRRKAETVNFVPGGRWDEPSVGTNALALALRRDRPATVFSAEHYAPIVHNWVCWAAPVHDPATGRQLGVLDLSTTWDRTHPIGMATAKVLARLLGEALPHPSAATDPSYPSGQLHPAGQRPGPPPAVDGLRLQLLGRAEAWLDGERLLLTRRQTEVLALLALHPDGLSLDQLHALLYGDHAVTVSTLKAEVSHLRAALHGQLTSRPYRLPMAVHSDVSEVLGALQRGDVREAVASYGGDLLPGTEAPGLVETSDFLAVALREALLGRPDPDAVLAYSSTVPHDTEVVETCLAALVRRGGPPHPAVPLLKGRLAAARR